MFARVHVVGVPRVGGCEMGDWQAVAAPRGLRAGGAQPDSRPPSAGRWFSGLALEWPGFLEEVAAGVGPEGGQRQPEQS